MDNAHDRDSKGRSSGGRFLGQNNPMARLKEKEVRAIRTHYAAGTITQTALANEYGVSQQIISKVVNMKTYSAS